MNFKQRTETNNLKGTLDCWFTSQNSVDMLNKPAKAKCLFRGG